MAHYLDSFETFTSLNPTSTTFDDDPSSYLSGPDFDLDAAVFSDPGPIPCRTSGPSTSSYTHFPDSFQSMNPTSMNPLGVSTASNSFAAYDPDSPFNSPAAGNGSASLSMSIKGMTRDGRFRTKLMGVGSDGGYLTSPLIVGKPRTDSRTGRIAPPEIAIDSPASTPRSSTMSRTDHQQHQLQQHHSSMRAVSMSMVPSLSMGSSASSIGYETTPIESGSRIGDLQVNDLDVGNQEGGGIKEERRIEDNEPLGMGISGVGDLAAQLELGDYGNPNLKIFAMPKPGAAKQSNDGECGFLPYPDHMPTTTLGRGKKNVVDVGTGSVDDSGSQVPPRSANKFVEHSFLKSPPPAQISAAPATGHRPKKAFPARTINKAKSCSALSATARRQAQADEPLYEPLTPTSHHTADFLQPSVSQNGLAINVTQPNSMPFSFSDLYNLGLTNEAPEEFELVKKNPAQFAQELLLADGQGGGGIGLGMGQDLLGVGGGNGYDGSGPGSAFSSPSTPYLSDPSPDMTLTNYAGGGGTSDLSSAEMFPATSIDSFFSYNGSTASSSSMQLGQSQSGRQRCATYGGPDTSFLGTDPFSPQQRAQTRNRQPSARAAYGNTNFSYPNRFAATDEILPVPPPHRSTQLQWDTGSQDSSLPIPPMPTTPTTARFQPHQRSVTGPALVSNQNQNIDLSFLYDQTGSNDLQAAYDRNLQTFDSLYETYGNGGGGGGNDDTPKASKRGRSRNDDDNDPDYTLSPQTNQEGTETRAKRLRSVASAPCLAPRRMRPGPKPKGLKSPQQEQEGVFSATLSPPIPQIRRATSPYASPLLSGGYTDDEGENGRTTMITYTPGPPPLPGQPRSSVPKDVIESLYSAIPGHVDKNGEKVGKRYVCLIEGCERTFPRKSAIESHIQTHLEDKPFVCPHEDCDASFVRQHDLRRHERIHSGNKPFPCPCGKGFARGDALARHRARGICSGSLVPRRI
ncbi:C2H2-type zinc finger protein [Sporobolomyces salmoneus]|uniref:C2H2-type zinc finger protein n=1 Tax=Sporobolomyces salmoneus TaxID=183962 RepID=UPI00316EF400